MRTVQVVHEVGSGKIQREDTLKAKEDPEEASQITDKKRTAEEKKEDRATKAGKLVK